MVRGSYLRTWECPIRPWMNVLPPKETGLKPLNKIQAPLLLMMAQVMGLLASPPSQLEDAIKTLPLNPFPIKMP